MKLRSFQTYQHQESDEQVQDDDADCDEGKAKHRLVLKCHVATQRGTLLAVERGLRKVVKLHAGESCNEQRESARKNVKRYISVR